MKTTVFFNNMGKLMVLSLLVCLLTITMGTVISAQDNTGSIEGTIFKNDGKTPIKDAKLVLERFENGEKTGKKYKSEATAADGEYKIEKIEEGKYKGKIMISGKEYKIKKVDFFVHIFAGETNYLSFSLKRRK